MCFLSFREHSVGGTGDRLHFLLTLADYISTVWGVEIVLGFSLGTHAVLFD